FVYITDGTSSILTPTGDFKFRDATRRMMRDNVMLTVIQTGSEEGFVASVNFGSVPDNESFRFLASSSFGRFLYASDCRYLDSQTIMSPALVETLGSPAPLPNFYHRNLLMREWGLEKTQYGLYDSTLNDLSLVNGGEERTIDIPRSRLINTGAETAAGGGEMISWAELRYPWDKYSLPPIVAEILCGYKDYTVNTRLDHILAARWMEGFGLKSVNVSRRSSGTATPGGERSSSNKSERVEIIFAKPWLPNVTILYTIKSRWYPSYGSGKVGLGSIWTQPGDSTKPPRIELNILAHHAFAISFVNVQDVNQAQADRLVKLHQHLSNIYETDDV
ncbi:hypothetical protein HDV05_003023, partial [Chytridiales sp. JEL 0842]